MSKTLAASNVTRRWFLLGAGSIAATGYLVVGKPLDSTPNRSFPSGKADYIVTVDVTKTPIHYSTPLLPDASSLNDKAGEIVTWAAKTTKTKHHLALIFFPQTPFVDNNNNPVYAFHGSQDDETNGIGIDASIASAASGSFPYCVGVWDIDAKKSYGDDPKIIVGKNGDTEAKTELVSASESLKKAVHLDPRLEGKINPIENKLEHVIKGMK